MKKQRGQQNLNFKNRAQEGKFQNRYSHISNEQNMKPSMLQNQGQGQMIPILSADEIKKLEVLRKESINPQNNEENPRTSIRPSLRASLRHSARQSKYNSPMKNKIKKKSGIDDSLKDETDTKKTDQTNITLKSIKKRKDKAIQEKDEGTFQKCCNVFQKNEQAEQNPFRKARESYLKN